MPSLKRNEPLKNHTTFGIGGPADFFATVTSIEEMVDMYAFAKREGLKYFVIGKGSNVLFDDAGFNGLVILNKIEFFEQENEHVHVGAGYSFTRLGSKLSRNGWGGLEFASGIPGSVGGAVFMNAGASGKETAEALTHVGFVNKEGFVEKEKSELKFSYRHSSFHEMDAIIVSAKFKVFRSEEAKKKQLDIVKYRTSTQPYGEASAGCIFRNSEEASGALIEKHGLKGFSIGDAEISTMHANFIINRGNATAKDVLALIDYIKKVTKTQLEMEVSFVPR